MNDFLLCICQILESTQDLRDNEFRFFLLYLLSLFKVIIKVWSTAEFKDSAKAIMINLYCIKVLYYPTVVEFLMDLIFSKSMLDVVIFDLIIPTIIKMVDLACHFSAVFQIKSFIDFRETTFA